MINKNIIIILCGILILTSEINSQSQFDFSGIDQFWILHTKLTNDEMPDSSEWSNLFNKPGYDELSIREFGKDYFIKYYSYAFMPSKQKEREEELAKNHWRVSYLKHLISISDKIELIKKYRSFLENDSNIITDAIEMTKEYLPDNIQNNLESPKISFLFFGNDARGYSSIIIDFLFAAENQELTKYFIAHEAHHYYRNKYLTFNFHEENSEESALLNTLNQLQAEGIADQIDKKKLFFNDGIMAKSGFADMYKKHFGNSVSIISQIDSLLVLISKEDSNQSEYINKLNSIIPMSGHPTGYFMANTISQELGKSELISGWNDLYIFFENYNRSVQLSSRGYPFISKDAMNFIKKLEKKYSM